MLEKQLRQDVDADSEVPWLFFREGFDWRWYSRSKVARLVLQTAERFPNRERATDSSCRVGDLTPSPDGVVECLASTLIDSSGGDWRIEGVASPDAIDFSRQLTSHEEAPLPGRRFATLDASNPSAIDQVLCVAPTVTVSTWTASLVWAFCRHVALVVEPDEDLFVATVKWSRPHLVICRFEHLEPLQKALGDWFEGSLRKFLRLRRVIVDDEVTAPTERISLPSWSDEIEICWWER